jgi:hypothetical protein
MRFKFIPNTGLSHGMIELTPTLAAQYLADKAQNRKISDRTVDKYSGTFTEATCIYQPLVFDENGRLIDGQHRCQSVVNSGVTIRITVIAGVPASAWDDMDGGIPRSLSNVLQAMNETNSSTMAAIIGAYFSYKNGFSRGVAVGVPRQDAIAFFEKEKDGLRKATEWIIARKSLAKIVPPSMAGLVYFLTLSCSERLDEFWNKLETGVGIKSKTDPTSMLRNSLMNDHRGIRKMRRDIKLAYLIKAANAALANEQLKVLRWASGEDFPELIIGKEKVAGAA